MTSIPSSLEGELLIRSILYQHTAPNTPRDDATLRIETNSIPSPSVSQIAVKAGFRHVEISTTDSATAASASHSFLWQGIDGTQLDTRVQGAEDLINGTTTAAPIWHGELPSLLGIPNGADDRNRSLLASDLRCAEFLNAVRPSGLANYPQTEIRAAWNILLANSADESDHDIANALFQAKSGIEKSLSGSILELGLAIDTRGLKRPVLVINNNSFYANEAVAVPLAPGEKPVTAMGPEGDAEEVQILQNPHREGDGTNFALFIAKNVPLHGYAVWDLGATLVPAESDDEVTVSPTHLENSSIRVEFDHATGLILKIFDKDSERDILNETFEVQRSGKRDLLLKSCANLFEITDHDGHGASAPVTHLDRAEVIEQGPVRASIRFSRTLPGGRSTIHQTVRLTARSARIDFVTEVEWHEDGGVLTVGFPVAINSSMAAYEIPLGYVERPTFRNFVDKVEPDDLSGHNWVDLSEGDYGIALLNDGCYGSEVRGNRLRLTLFSAGSNNQSEAGPHKFTYSLLPHGGDLREGEVVENSYAINNVPLCSAITGNGPGKLPLERSFFEVDSASIFIEAIKRAENEENAIIVRMYEAHNTRGTVLLSTTLPAKSAWLCDLVENNLAQIPLDNGEALLPFHPFEIITVKFSL